MKFYRPRRIGDLDGMFKAVIDGLKGFAFEDDKQIVEIHAHRLDDKWKPRVEVEIIEITCAPELFSEVETTEEIPFS
jgi:Holliday junction resolvase RusA-like endonuclease